MKLNRINNINFYGKIIDSHVHIGQWSENGNRRDYTNDIDIFIKSTLNNGDTVEKVIVSNLDCMVRDGAGFISDEITGNKRLLELAEKNSSIVPLATCQPGYGKVENIKTLLDENPNKFYGFKFHPEQLNIPVSDNRYLEYLKLASEKELPCLFHSARTFDINYPGSGVGNASNLSSPALIYDLARKYKDVPIVMAHWGGDGDVNIDFTTRCIIDSIKRKDANLYADISWVDCNDPQKPNLKRIITQLKEENALDRVLFGTDAPLGRFSAQGENGIPPKQAYEENIINIKNMIKREFPKDADDIIDKIFYQNANNLFKINRQNDNGEANSPKKPSAAQKPQETPKIGGKRKIIFAIIGGLLVAGAAWWHYYKKSKNNQKSTDVRA